MTTLRQFNTPISLSSAGLSATHNSNTVANIFTTGGNVGIGTTSPQRQVHMNGVLRIDRNSDTSGFILTRTSSDYSTVWKSFQIGVNSTTSGNGSFVISDQGTTAGNIGNQRLIIDNNGNIGIGAISPTTTLDVSGTGRISTSLTTGALYSTNQTTTNIVATNISTSNLVASTVASNVVSATTITGANLSLSGNLNVAGTLTTVNITSTNLVNTNVSAGVVVASTSLSATGNSNTIGNVIFTTGGSVGIGTGTPTTNTLLHLRASDTINTLFVDNLGGGGGVQPAIRAKVNALSSARNILQLENSNGIQMIFRDDGRLGIGTTTPSGVLHVYESTGTSPGGNSGSIVISRGNTGGNSSITFLSTINSGSDYGYIRYIDSVTNTGYTGYNYFGASNIESAALVIGCENDGSIVSGSDSVIISPVGNVALTPGNGTTYISGNVGIGTTAPAYNLDVAGAFRATGVVYAANSTVISSTATNYSTTSGALNITGDAVITGSSEIMYTRTGVAAPILNGRSAGTKIVLYPDTNITRGDYSMGVETNHTWFQVPSSTQGYRFYQGTSASFVVASSGNILLGGAGNFNSGINLPTGGFGIHWHTGSSGVSRIYDDGDLRICTDDNMRFYTGSSGSTPGTERMTLTATGLGVGTNGQISSLCVNGNANNGNGALHVVSLSSSINSGRSQDGASFKAWSDGNNIIQFYNSSDGYRGGINGNGSGAVSYNTSSDRRLKKDVTNMNSAINVVKQMRPVNFTWKSDNKVDFGFIAQEIYELFPGLRPNLSSYSHCNCDTTDMSNGILCNCEEHDHDEPVDKEGNPLYYGLDYGRFTPYLTKALQETIYELETAQQTIQQHESTISQLQEQIVAQQQQINDILTRLG